MQCGDVRSSPQVFNTASHFAGAMLAFLGGVELVTKASLQVRGGTSMPDLQLASVVSVSALRRMGVAPPVPQLHASAHAQCRRAAVRPGQTYVT